MIEIPQPSIALNSHDVPEPKYEMASTWNVPVTASADDILSRVTIFSAIEEKPVKCLVINCHGYYDHGINRFGTRREIATGGYGLFIGQGIRLADTQKFRQILGCVKCIIITACGTAHVTNDLGNRGDGELFCSRIAKYSGAYVIAPRYTQLAGVGKLPKNHIDNFEREVVRYNPSGALDDYGLWSKTDRCSFIN